MQTPNIRLATHDDLPQLAHLWYEQAALNQQHDSRFRLAPDAVTRWTETAAVWLNGADSRIFAADDGSGVVGYLVARVEPGPPGMLPDRVGVIDGLAIDSHRYQRGVGRALVDSAQVWLREQSVTRLSIQVPRRRAVEQAFWRALGAKEWMDTLWMTF